jgi:hypothetical protein
MCARIILKCDWATDPRPAGPSRVEQPEHNIAINDRPSPTKEECEYDQRHRELLPDRTRAWLPQRCIVPPPDYPTAAAGWAAAVEKALQAREMRAEFDRDVREQCRQRPFEGLLMSAKAMITGVGIKLRDVPAAVD